MQTPGSDCLKHCISNDQFQLRLSLSDSRLVINLSDYTDWIVYEKNYTEEDIGKQIHRKLELIDIYSAFFDTKEKSQNEKNKMKYKIESGGKVITYTQVQLNRKGAVVEEIYESKLQLDKKQDIKQIDIMMIRANIEKKEVVSKFQERIEQISNSNEELKNKTKQMQKQIKRLNESNQKLTEMVIEIQKQQKNQQQLNQTIQKQLSVLKKLNQCVKLDNESPYFSKFKVNKNQITYIGQANCFTQFIVNQKIPTNKIYKFSFKIVKSNSKNIMIGIIQKSKQISSRTSYNSNNAWCFYGPGTGYKYPGSIIEGRGFNQGDLVEVQVRLKDKSIVWNINGAYNASFKDVSRLGNFFSNQSFYPYVEIYENGECVQWMGSSEQ